MFIGHYAVALGAKKAAPTVKLGTLFLAAQFLDLLWPIFLLLGLEHARIDPGNTAFTPFDFYDYPFSHSLLTTIGWSLLVGGIYFLIRRRWQGSLVVCCAVFSHWLLDFISHRPDLPIAPGLQTVVGLGLWNSIIGTILIESALFFTGIYFYVRITKATDWIGKYAFWGLIAMLSLSYIANILAPPPSNMHAVAIAGLSQWIFIYWAYWIDRHRQNREQHSFIKIY
jgi:hypothetical protein